MTLSGIYRPTQRILQKRLHDDPETDQPPQNPELLMSGKETSAIEKPLFGDANCNATCVTLQLNTIPLLFGVGTRERYIQVPPARDEGTQEVTRVCSPW